MVLQNVTYSTPALIALSLFLLAYLLVLLEEFTQLKKSKPLVLVSGIIWVIIAVVAHQKNLLPEVNGAIRHHLMDYAELLLFIIVAITYINALTERKVFEALRYWLTQQSLSFRQLFWITGLLTFIISAIADNLTTALAMSAVILAVGKESPRFMGIACTNVVVAANAGGAFSPFGDITTLMVWQAGIIPLSGFFKLLLPSIINFLVPAVCMHFALPKSRPHPPQKVVRPSEGGKRIIALFVLTILTTVLLQHYFKLPPVIGMTIGLAYLQFFAYYTKYRKNIPTIEIFPAIKELDWDTLLFFYGVIMAIGGLSTLGYLEILSHALYSGWENSLSPLHQHTPGNILIGLLSALVDNIPLMFAVITMHPTMSEGQWLLLTLTSGVGGSLLSIGSAAGVSVMGQAQSIYTFSTHLKWTWAIALGYIASILCHLWWNAGTF